jgi:hypothetical protein
LEAKEMLLKKIIFILSILTFLCHPSYASAAFQRHASTLTLQTVYVQDDWCYLAVSSDVTGTCLYYVFRFRFNVTTHNGKAMLGVLLMAKALNKTIEVWYNDSSVPGTNQTNGCNAEAVSLATGISIP